MELRPGIVLAVFASAAFLSAGACTGNIGDPARSSELDGKVSPGPSPMRRLTRFEYDNTVRDLLGDTTRPSSSFPPEEIGNGFGNDANALHVSNALAQSYFDTAQALAESLVADDARLSAALGCDPATMGEEPCAQTFIEQFGARAFRRPLTAEDKTRLFTVFQQVRALPNQDFGASVAAVVQTVLQMPDFLYRVEFGALGSGAEGPTRVGQYEMASRLSYLLWGSMPDETLFAAAAKGALGTAGEVRVQAERMLEDPRAREMVEYFHNTLFGLQAVEGITRDPALFPEFTAEIPSLLKRETSLFLDSVMWDGPGDLATILSAPYSFMNGTLASYYGVSDRPGAPTTDAFQRVDLDPSRAAGFLTHGSLMAALTPGNSQTNPVLRGKFVLTKLLCRSLAPPSSFTPMPPPPDPTLTTRERFEAHSSQPACAPCHKLLDPLGFSFEHYDQIGRWRDVDNGKPVDASGVLVDTDVDGSIKDATELAARLSLSQEVRACMVGQWLTFAYGRAETDEDTGTRTVLEDTFRESDARIPALIVALTQTDAFLFRQPVRPAP